MLPGAGDAVLGEGIDLVLPGLLGDPAHTCSPEALLGCRRSTAIATSVLLKYRGPPFPIPERPPTNVWPRSTATHGPPSLSRSGCPCNVTAEQEPGETNHGPIAAKKTVANTPAGLALPSVTAPLVGGGGRIRAARETAGLSQRDLPVRMGTSQAAVARVEAGGVGATLTTLHRVAAALGLELNIDLRHSA
jgi:DNA-binding XRE family transcriptional regulator